MSTGQKYTGIVLSEYPLGENDKRLTILTKEKGKISVISRGCRKAKSHLHAVSQAVTYADFLVAEGRNYYYLTSGDCKDSFGYVKDDLDRILYSTYFAEVADYFTVEDQDEREILNLLYFTFKAMKKELIPLSFIRRIYEFRVLTAAGYGMQCFSCINCGSETDLVCVSDKQGGVLCEKCAGLMPAHRALSSITPEVLYALQYTASVPLQKLYSFNLQENIRDRFEQVAGSYFTVQADHRFRSEEMLSALN